VELVLSTSFAIVLAIRITSYYSEDLSKDVAKMLPFALLGVFLVDPSYFDFDTTLENLNTLPRYANTIALFIFFNVFVEWTLRIVRKIKKAILPSRKIMTEEET
jgi:hypothetical protein